MKRRRPFAAVLVLAMAACCQAQDPFGGPAAPPAGAPPAAAKKAGKVEVPDEAPLRQPLVIELLRSSNPTTPLQLVQAAQIAFQYGRADEAKLYLAKLIAAKPPDEALAPLAAPHADFLIQLTANADLQPEGRQAAELILSATQRMYGAADPLAAAVAQLSSADEAARYQALRILASAGQAAVNPLLKALADKGRASEHPQIRSALVALAGVSEPPLLAVLQSGDSELRMQAIAVLARIGSRRAAIHLIRPALDGSGAAEMRELAAAALRRIAGAVPDLDEADVYLRREIGRFLNGEIPYDRDPLDQVRLWRWDQAAQQVLPVTLSRFDAGVMLAARAAADLYALRGADPSVQRLMLLTNLELAKILVGLDQPLPVGPGTAGAAALSAGPAAVSQVLAEALAQRRTAAAIAAAEVLGQLGDASVLHPASGLSPLAEAFRSSDRRLRLAATLAAVKLDPGGSFPGSGFVADNLARFAKTRGNTFILVGHPIGEEAQALVTYFGPLGFEGEGAYFGRLVAERAFENPDVDFLVISDAIDSPPVEELVQWLRRDYRTAGVPVGIMSRSERLDELREFFKVDLLTTVFPRIHSPEVAAGVIGQLKTIAGRNLVGRDERLSHGLAALVALNVLAVRDETLHTYDVFRHEGAIIAAMHHPVLLPEAVKLLARLGTPTAQAALLDVASQSNRPIADRQAAAVAFAAAVKTRGLRLTQSQILQQYDRYNASAVLDQATQALLGSILDTIEAYAAAANPAAATGAAVTSSR